MPIMGREKLVFLWNLRTEVEIRKLIPEIHYTSMLLPKIFSIGTTTLKMIRRGFSRSNADSKLLLTGFKELALEEKISVICNDMQSSISRSIMKSGISLFLKGKKIK